MKPHRKVLLAATAASLIALTGCATTSTPYQPIATSNAAAGGYSEVRLAADRYRVTFAGNTYTSRDTVEGYLLYRAAELARDNGYDWFTIVDREMNRDVRNEVVPDPFYRPWYGSGFGYWRPYWRFYPRGTAWQTWYPYYGDPFWAQRYDTRSIERFEASAEIVMGRGPKAADGKTFYAREVIERLGPTIKRP